MRQAARGSGRLWTLRWMMLLLAVVLLCGCTSPDIRMTRVDEIRPLKISDESKVLLQAVGAAENVWKFFEIPATDTRLGGLELTLISFKSGKTAETVSTLTTMLTPAKSREGTVKAGISLQSAAPGVTRCVLSVFQDGNVSKATTDLQLDLKKTTLWHESAQKPVRLDESIQICALAQGTAPTIPDNIHSSADVPDNDLTLALYIRLSEKNNNGK